jgi:hypothetical protein
MSASARDEHARGVVDPELFDRRVVEKRLERTEAGHASDQLADHRVDVTHRSDDASQRSLVVSTDDIFGQAAYDERVALGVDALAAYSLAHPLVERLDQVGVRVSGDDGHR